jgi:hypothetical protein
VWVVMTEPSVEAAFPTIMTVQASPPPQVGQRPSAAGAVAAVWPLNVAPLRARKATARTPKRKRRRFIMNLL